MKKLILNVLTDEEVEQLNTQKLLNNEIENQGVFIGWKAIGVNSQLTNLKNQIIVRYKNTKVMRFESGNILLCSQDGCYTPVKQDMEMCDFHNKGGIRFRLCTSKTICTSQASFGYEDKQPLFCKSHSEIGMIDVKNKKCEYPGCKTQPGFGILGERAKFCVKHKTEDMTDVSHKKCIYPECNVRARYEYLGETVPKYCSEHQLPDMVDIERTKCGYEGCEITPLYGFEDEKLRYCKTHKLDEMKNLRSKKCSFLGCELKAAFGNEGGSPEFCKKHMESQMVNVYNRKCLSDGCSKQPSFGFPGQQFLYCYSHKLDGMKNLKDKRCTTIGCDIRPTYGYLFSKIHNHCLEHSTLNEYGESKTFPRCSVSTCFNEAVFMNYEDKSLQPIRCIDHKLSTDIEMVEKICLLCSIKVYIPDNKDICSACGNYRYKIVNCKENEVKLFLKSHDIKFIHNKPVHLDGSSKRPDFLINSNFGIIVMECDEFQHKGYEKEQDRMKIIYNDVQLLSLDSELLFIRYNPDNYKGLQYNINGRLEYSHFLLDYFINLDKLNIKLGVMYLFYDGFDGNSQMQEIQK